MDALITAAARALAAGDPLGALNRVALRDDAQILRRTGFQQLPLERIGLRLDEYRTSLPAAPRQRARRKIKA